MEFSMGFPECSKIILRTGYQYRLRVNTSPSLVQPKSYLFPTEREFTMQQTLILFDKFPVLQFYSSQFPVPSSQFSVLQINSSYFSKSIFRNSLLCVVPSFTANVLQAFFNTGLHNKSYRLWCFPAISGKDGQRSSELPRFVLSGPSDLGAI